MNYRLRFLISLITELSEQSALSATRDIAYLMSRFEHEGVSFLTITLPSFSDGLERAIERGMATPDDFRAFARRSKGCLPKFLSGFTSRVFNDDGSVKQDADPDAIYSIRQISRYFKKALIECSEERLANAELKYIQTDLEFTNHEATFDKGDILHLTSLAAIITGALCSSFDKRSISCNHGPGATAEKLRSNERRHIKQWPIRSEPWFPSSWHILPNIGWTGWRSSVEEYGCAADSGSNENSFTTLARSSVIRKEYQGREFEYLSEKDEAPVRVVFVPKTLKTPRVIAIEPSYMQFMQQGVLNWLVPQIERHPLTRKSVHFTDQTINRASALTASLDRKNATIDLSEASDRVSLELVKLLFGSVPKFLDQILACRSSRAVTPSGKEVILNKFASMGSALCFPIEALCFYILIQHAIHKHVGVPPTWKSIRSFSRWIHVYGDDIIVPVVWLKSVVESLEAYGLKVNREKSFSQSHFRESCGGDYYNGYDVKPSYFRVDPSRLDKQLTMNELVSLAEHSNQLYWKGLWRSAQAIRDFVESRIGPVPVRTYESNGIYFSSCRRNTYNAWSKNYCRPVSKGLTPITVSRIDNVLNDNIALCTLGLSNIGNDNSVDFTSSVRPRVLRKKRGWIY